MNQENTNLDGKLALRIGDSLLGSVEDPASSPSLPKNDKKVPLLRKYKNITLLLLSLLSTVYTIGIMK